MRIAARTGDQRLELTIERQNGHFALDLGGRRLLVDAQKLEGDFYSIVMDGRSYEVSVEARGDGYVVRHGAAECLVQLDDPSRGAREARPVATGPERVTAVMPGRVVRVLVLAGETVTEGQGIVVIEAMKMENEISASKPGRVASVEVRPGQAVEAGALLAVIE